MNYLKTMAVAGTATLMLAACGGSNDPASQEKAAENLAASYGVDADVTVDESGEVSNVVINSPGGGQVGNNLDLPDGFPGDVSIPEGWALTGTTRVPPDGFSIQMMTEESVADAGEAIRTAMSGEGWTETASGSASPQFSQIGFEKDGRMTNFTIIDNAGKATVQLITMTRPS